MRGHPFQIAYTLLLLLAGQLAVGQYKPPEGHGLYNTGKHTIDKGWYFGLGLTYMAPYLKKTETINSTDSLNNTYRQEYTAKPTGKIGLLTEIGKFKMNDKKWINFIDYGLAYKWFRGGETFTQETFTNSNLTSTATTKASFSDHVVSLHLNLGYRYDRDEKTFFVNGIGLNADYFLFTSRKDGSTIPGVASSFIGPFAGELHYFFGVGIKTDSRLMIMPTIETPIFAAYPFNHIRSTHDYFNTRSRPILLKVKFMVLEKGSKSCPKVFNPMGVDPNNNLE